jgi:hypothetical protein
MNGADEFLRGATSTDLYSQATQIIVKLFGGTELDAGTAQGSRSIDVGRYVVDVDCFVRSDLTGT